VLGISVSAVYMGLALGPFAGGYLTQYTGWTTIFWISGLLGVVANIIAFKYLGNDQTIQKPAQKADFKGVIFYMLGLVALVYGSSHIPGLSGWIIMLSGVTGLLLFWYIESRASNPVFDTKLFTHNKLFAFSNLAALINYTATTAIVFFLSLYLQQVQGFPPRTAGLILVAQPIMMSVFSPLVGRLSDKIQPRYLASMGMAMCSIGLFVLSQFDENTPVWTIVTVLLWEGIGFALFSSPNMNTIMSSVEKSSLGIASGTAASMRVVGQIISMTIVTLLFSVLFDGKMMADVSGESFLTAMHWGFGIFGILGIIGIYFSFNRGKVVRMV
jgi:MFS family permease